LWPTTSWAAVTLAVTFGAAVPVETLETTPAMGLRVRTPWSTGTTLGGTC